MPLLDPQIISLDSRFAAVNKPPGWLVIPGRGGDSQSLKSWVEKEVGHPVFVVHRIDRETSGVVLFAMTETAHREANDAFAAHQVKKTYDLIAQGELRSPVLRVTDPIGGSRSITQVEVVEKFGPQAFLGRARPVTGRRHQIRIHLSGLGCPLLGDLRYEGESSIAFAPGSRLSFQRTALHAAQLELPRGERFEAPWPSDFSDWVRQLRLRECRN